MYNWILCLLEDFDRGWISEERLAECLAEGTKLRTHIEAWE